MKNYIFSFRGRQTGAIGIFYQITETYKCESMSEAKSCLYRDYEHILNLRINGSNDLSEYNKAEFIKVPQRNYAEQPRK